LKTARQMASRFVTRSGIYFMQVLALVPLSWTRALGVLLGWVLYAVVGARRRVVDTNLALCFRSFPGRTAPLECADLCVLCPGLA